MTHSVRATEDCDFEFDDSKSSMKKKNYPEILITNESTKIDDDDHSPGKISRKSSSLYKRISLKI